MAEQKHLWEISHPYYCNLCNYYASENVGDHHLSFADFLFVYGDTDFDMNLLFRFDWEEKKDDGGKTIEPPDWSYRNGTLSIFWMVQRKGLYRFTTVKVCRNDEQAVKDFLKPRWEHMKLLWEGIS